MRYAGFWKRFVSAWVDCFVIIPFGLLNAWISGGPKPLAIASQILFSCAGWLYVVYFQARWGQTIGKMATKIRIVRVDGTPIGRREALLRNSVDGGLCALGLIGEVFAILAIPDAQYRAAGWMERNTLIQAATPAALVWMPWAMNIWVWGELITLLSNKKRRALHDFIAGTVVIQLDPVIVEPSVASATATRSSP